VIFLHHTLHPLLFHGEKKGVSETLLVALSFSSAPQVLFIFIQCSLQVPNNYETDLILPIIEKVSELANVSYGISDDQTKRYLKVSMAIFIQAAVEF
jgi:hypothetical protein